MRLSVIVSFLIISSVEPLLAQNAYVRLGKQAYIDGDFKAAVMQLEKACLVDSTNANAMWMLGYSYFHSDNYLKSIVAYSKVISISPADADAYYYRAMAKRHMSKDNLMNPADKEKYLLGAIYDYTKAIEISPTGSKVASFYQNRGIAYREYGLFKLQANSRSYDKARGINSLRASIDDLQKVLANDPSRNDIASLVDMSKENLAATVGHH